MFRAYAADSPAGPVAVLSGEADLTVAAELAAVLDDCLTRDAARLTIDVAALTFADLAALRELIRAARIVRRNGGQAYLVRPGRALSRLVGITGTGMMFTVLD
jgi:anti-anti-sigma factor